MTLCVNKPQTMYTEQRCQGRQGHLLCAKHYVPCASPFPEKIQPDSVAMDDAPLVIPLPSCNAPLALPALGKP